MHDTRITIKFEGKVLKLDFNNYATADIGRVYGLDPIEANRKLAEDLQANYMRVMAIVIYAGLIGTAYRDEKDDPEFTQKQVREWVGNAQPEDEKSILDAFNKYRYCVETRYIKKPEQKKTPIGMPRAPKNGTGKALKTLR